MKSITKMLMAVLCAIVCLISGISSEAAQTPKRPLIQMAILLDTSGSMDGLIDQAKSQLWKIVNELVIARKKGERPELQVALYEYGKSSIPADEGYIRMIVPLTNDLDRVSEELFKLTTNGGNEYCGQVIQSAARGLQWSTDKEDLKLIFIAGNESFAQGTIDYKVAVKEAITKGILVNTIHCGSYEEGVEGMWKDGALRADGAYLTIDQNRKIQQITAPQDTEISRLNEELNQTYIPFGREGSARQERQKVQDSNAQGMAAASMTQRAVFKSSANYSNEEWDLVDATKNGSVKLEDVDKEALPEAMQKMSETERKAYVEENSKKRGLIQEQIQTLSKERDKYVAGERAKLAASPQDTLDQAMIKSLRNQATNKNFQFE